MFTLSSSTKLSGGTITLAGTAPALAANVGAVMSGPIAGTGSLVLTAVPEPGTWLLLLLALACGLVARRRRG